MNPLVAGMAPYQIGGDPEEPRTSRPESRIKGVSPLEGDNHRTRGDLLADVVANTLAAIAQDGVVVSLEDLLEQVGIDDGPLQQLGIIEHRVDISRPPPQG